jgi:hypothetical protein
MQYPNIAPDLERIDTLATARKQWVEKWIGQPIEQWDEQERRKVLEDCTTRWKKDRKRTERVLWPRTDPRGRKVVLEDTPPNKGALKLYARLRKAESSILV